MLVFDDADYGNGSDFQNNQPIDQISMHTLSKFVIYSLIELKIGAKFIISAVIKVDLYVMHVCP